MHYLSTNCKICITIQINLVLQYSNVVFYKYLTIYKIHFISKLLVSSSFIRYNFVLICD